MQLTTSRAGLAGRRLAALFTVAVVAAACSRGERAVTDPSLPGNNPSNPQLRQAAFILDVNTRTREVRITAPTLSISPSFSLTGGSQPSSRPSLGGPNMSIIAGDVIQLTTSNYFASAVGAFQPGKVRVTFDVNVTNRLSGVQLITPTFPVPPVGTNGIVLFPFETNVTVTSGGASVGGDGTDVLIDLPNRGQVAPSTDWDGSPFNFFNDTGCGAGSNDCYRWQRFAQPLGAGATSEAQMVGFDIDPTVANFRARLIVAADLANSGPPQLGSITGLVTSPERGNLSGVTVSATPGAFAGSTAGDGTYTLSSVSTGPKTVSLSGLPAGCTNPGSQTTTVTNGGTSTVNFTVSCTYLTGTVTGTLTSSLGGGVPNVVVVVTPTGLAAQPSVTSGVTGLWTRTAVPFTGAGAGTITLSNVPATCVNGSPYSYTGLTSGGTVTVNITLSCVLPPQGYAYTAVWGAPSGGSVTLTLRIDMGSYNDPNLNGTGADDIYAIQGSFTYNASRLTFGSCSNVSGSGLQNLASNGSVAGTVQIANFTTLSGLQTGLQGIAQCTFNVTGSGSVSTATSISTAESASAYNLVPKILITEGTVVLP
jgi:hypothetical protein